MAWAAAPGSASAPYRDDWFAAVGSADTRALGALAARHPELQEARTRLLGRTALIEAVAAGRSDLSLFLIERGASLDAREARTERTALHYAAASGRRDLVELLLDRGADPGIRDALTGRTPADFARAGGFEALARRLEVPAGRVRAVPPLPDMPAPFADSGILGAAIIPLSERSSPPERPGSPAPPAGERPGAEVVPPILPVPSPPAPQAAPPSREAARPETADALVVRLARDTSAASRSISADENEDLPRVDAWDTRPPEGEQWNRNVLVFEAVRAHDAAALASALAAGGQIEARDWDGFTPIFYAVFGDDTALMARLLAQGAAPDPRDRFGWTPLMHASWRGHASAVRMLAAAGASVEARNPDSSTALHLASERNRFQVVETLLELGARPDVRTRDKRFLLWTPLLLAASKGHDVCVGYLLRAGAAPNIRAANGWTALKAAAINGRAMSEQLIRMQGGEL